MTSPIATGGAGIHLESWIAADYLAATLTGSAVRGLPAGAVATGVKLQRAFEGAPLDDVIVSATTASGTATLSLQAKRTLSFGGNALFREVMTQCWETFSGTGFQPGRDRFGVAMGTPDARFESAGRNCLTWARQSSDASDFLRRIAAKDVASDPMRAFVATVRGVLTGAATGPVDDDALWRFLKHLVVVTDDFEQADESANRLSAIERLRLALPPEDDARAPDLWRALVDIADRAKPAAGSLDRAALVEWLQSEFHLGPLRPVQPDLERIRTVSERALADIRADLGGVRLTRSALAEDLDSKLTEARVVEVVGEAGSGKSALLKALAQPFLDEGPVLFLSARRLPTGAPGWEGLAAHWHLTTPLPALLVELATVTTPCLFIDGIERLEDPGAWLAVNDLLRAIRQAPSAARWRVVLSARANALRYRLQLDLDDWERGMARVIVGDLDADEVTEIGAAHPKLAPLIAPGGRAAALAARPYLLDRLIRLGTAGLIGDSPISEIDLMLEMWKGSLGAAPLVEAEILARQDALLALGRQRLAAPARPLTSVGIEREALLGLVRDDLLRHDSATRTPAFAHDILEDWTLCQALHHDGRPLAEIVESLGQPLWLLDAVALLAQWRLEQASNPDEWFTLLGALSRPPLQPRWRRAVLCAPLLSTRAGALLVKVSETLWADDAVLLGELMLSMRTIEVEPDPLALDATLFPDCDDVTRMQLAHIRAVPRPRSWRYFFPWLIRRLDRIPVRHVDEATRVLESWAQSWRWFPAWAADPIATWSRGWLARIERQRGWESYEDVRALLGQMGVGHDDEAALRERLQLQILTAAHGALDQVAAHLQEIRSRSHHEGAEFFIRYANWLVEPMPAELVDFLLAVMCRDFNSDDSRRWPYGDLNELGIAFEGEFSPASHLRPPFLFLLRQHPDQGLRLINGLCNHAMAVWRVTLEDERSATPLPVRIRFSWGERLFWGHAREYTWFRGTGPGPYPVESALMALEVWLEEQVATGVDMEALFHRVLDDNQCVGVLGACISVALANPERALKAVLPLAASPQLWHWDMQRRMQEHGDSMSNVIGLPRDRIFLREVAKRNRLPHRQRMLRELAFYYVLDRDQSLRADLLQRLSDLKGDDLPFDFAEQPQDPALSDELRECIRRMRAELSSENYSAHHDEAEQRLLIQYTAPAELTPPLAQTEQHEILTRAMKVALWAERSMEANAVQTDLSLADAIEIARSLDSADLFDHPPDVTDFPTTNRIGAVAGAAAIALKFGELAGDLLGWGRDVIYRAAGTPLDAGPMTFAQSAVMFHPVVFSARGLTALVERGRATDDERQAILELVCHPLHKVMEAVYRGLAMCWEQDPLLCWQAFALGMRLSVEPWAALDQRREYGLARPEEEMQWMLGVLAEIVADWQAGQYSALPVIPLPWVPDEGADPDHRPRGCHDDSPYRRSEIAFLWHIAPVVLTAQPLVSLLGTSERRHSVIRLASDLLAWTIMDACPPFERQHGGRAYEWGSTFLEWCARLTEHLTVAETSAIILDPIRAVENSRDAGYLLETLMFGFVRHRFGQDQPPDASTIAVWGLLCDMLFAQTKTCRRRSNDWWGDGYDKCVPLVVFVYGGFCLFDHPWPALDAVRSTVETWVERFSESAQGYAYLLVFLTYAGRGLLPDPALGWLERVVEARGQDVQFWRTSDNGSRTAALLEQMLDEHGGELKRCAGSTQRLITMTDLLISVGVRQAARLQQRLARTTENPGGR
ncbi:hypothetical protein [Thiobaca trueperi]|uniref:AAA+ ATPase domain-containing protein n=1 Tax=Thiobaca trueperi TaxID=127458 RepID=A0A4R3N1B7_9GAMM|nr:hypothetical protein [Thiobaca trueperi]TCT22838.1 hypothetical protein EDC35_102169 [Thiobaca trueperi]